MGLLRRSFVSAVLLVWAAAFAVPTWAGPREYDVKAVFLYRFAQFVEWPAGAFADESAPLCIGVLGEDPFGGALDDAVRGESVQKHRLVVQRARSLEDVRGCQMVFVSRSEAQRVPELLTALQHSAVLTVSDVDNFARQGGVIGFYVDGQRVRFDINPGAAQRQQLRIRSELLGVARIVEPEA